MRLGADVLKPPVCDVMSLSERTSVFFCYFALLSGFGALTTGWDLFQQKEQQPSVERERGGRDGKPRAGMPQGRYCQ